MKVSVITAVRNGAATVGATLDSIAAQTYPHIEHIVIDGASTDSTLAVVAARGRHIAQLLSEPDEGVYDAFNKGLQRVTGDLVAYLNAGDTYTSPHVVAEVVSELEASGADALFGDVVVTDGVGGPVLRRFRSSGFSPRRIAFGFMPAHPALFMRRAVYDRFGTYDASYRIAGDFEYVARAFARGGIRYKYLAQVLTAMPRGGLSSSGWRSHVIITQEMRRACRANGVRTNAFLLLARLPLKYFREVLVRS